MMASFLVICQVKDITRFLPKELEKLWEIPELCKKIKGRIRRPGSYHEWHLVSRTPQFKKWEVSMDDIKEMRSLIEDVQFEYTEEEALQKLTMKF